MKRLVFALTAVVVFATACNAQSDVFEVTRDGIGPIKLGMDPATLPASVEGLYDKIEISYDFYDAMEEIYCFMLNGEIVMQSPLTLSYLEIYHPKAAYEGIRVGISAYEAAKSGAELKVYENYRHDGDIWPFFSKNGVNFEICYPHGKDVSNCDFADGVKIESRTKIVNVTSTTFPEGTIICSIVLPVKH